ncbi:BglII/BstYI family type II restriction endonuclease [Candidatus Neomarinimicrobiota bacterium]
MILETEPMNEYRRHDDDKEIIDVLHCIEIDPHRSRRFRERFEDILEVKGWITRYRIHANLSVTVTGARDLTAVCLQLGNVARIFYDVLKLQYLHSSSQISQGIIICPIESSGNRAYLDRLIRESEVFKDVITVPFLAIGIEHGGPS